MTLIDKFSKIAERIANAMGHPLAFCLAVLLIVGWASTGNYFEWSTEHALFINTITTVVTFLLGFLILNTANRSGKAEQLKLDELIRALDTANNNFMRLEDKDKEEVIKREEEIKEALEAE